MSETLRNPGDIVAGRYEIKEIIGHGSFAEVYKGIDMALDREVAVKLMRFQSVAKPGVDSEALQNDMMERFYKEARVVAKLRDPFTVTLFDFGTDTNGDLYMVLEYVPGETLRDHIASGGPMSAERTVRVLQQVLSALREAHAYGLLHRDLKPENIMIFSYMGAPDQVRVVDFGIAKALEERASDMTAAGILLGTPRYIPPERIEKADLMPASDIYSLGGVAYYMLTGEEIYADTKNVMDIVRKQAAPESVKLPASLDTPDTLRAIVDRMLIKDVQGRYGAAQQVLTDLDEHAISEAIARRERGESSTGNFSAADPRLDMAKTEVMAAVPGPGNTPTGPATQHMSIEDLPSPTPTAQTGAPMRAQNATRPQMQTLPPDRDRGGQEKKGLPTKYIVAAAVVAVVLLLMVAIIAVLLYKFVINPS